VNFCFCLGSEPGSDDGAKWARGGLSVRRPRLSADRSAQPGDAAARLQLPLPRTETRSHRRLSRLHPPRVENVAESAQDLRSQR